MVPDQSPASKLGSAGLSASTGAAGARASMAAIIHRRMFVPPSLMTNFPYFFCNDPASARPVATRGTAFTSL
jgi:hypothetical protein